MNYMMIIGGFIFVVILYLLYLFFTNNTLTSGLQPLNSVVTYTYDKLVNPGSNVFCYQGWIYLNVAPTSGSKTNVFKRDKNFSVNLTGQVLTVDCSSNGNGTSNVVMTITDQLPIQKWTYLVINVNSQRIVEAYINGKLVKTVKTEALPASPSTVKPLTLGDANLSGYITKFTRTDQNMNADAVWTAYLSGNGLNTALGYLMPYNINLAISKDDIIQRQFRFL
jgi:Concanavalin A-like lectin/glucanases superfamily